MAESSNLSQHLVQAESYTAADAETMELPDKEEEAAQAQPDPFARLEKGVEDKRRGREGAERIAELREDSAAKYKDDYTINKALRRQLRCNVPAIIFCPRQQAMQDEMHQHHCRLFCPAWLQRLDGPSRPIESTDACQK